MEEEYKRFTISLPPELYEEIETFRNKLGISRSDFIRKAIYSYLIGEETIPVDSDNVVGCISLIMAHRHIKPENDQNNHIHSKEVDHDANHHHDHEFTSRPIYVNVHQSDEILKTDIQHHFGDIIISTMHIHLEFEKCLEIIAVSGPKARVIQLKEDLQALKSVISTGFFIIDRE
ncbi:MAG: CopG family ribbon-helix-helix protein [Promethearchaeota archaeon]|nr:MAG: CopG family ribbon-helix-helix protein [Candidatus Lokiarchaeota archaeon]